VAVGEDFGGVGDCEGGPAGLVLGVEFGDDLGLLLGNLEFGEGL
jgi:hypothetical protein